MKFHHIVSAQIPYWLAPCPKRNPITKSSLFIADPLSYTKSLWTTDNWNLITFILSNFSAETVSSHEGKRRWFGPTNDSGTRKTTRRSTGRDFLLRLFRWVVIPSFYQASTLPSIHSFFHSFIFPFIHLLIYSLFHSFIQLFTHLFTHSFIIPFICSVIHSFISTHLPY